MCLLYTVQEPFRAKCSLANADDVIRFDADHPHHTIHEKEKREADDDSNAHVRSLTGRSTPFNTNEPSSGHLGSYFGRRQYHPPSHDAKKGVSFFRRIRTRIWRHQHKHQQMLLLPRELTWCQPLVAGHVVPRLLLDYCNILLAAGLESGAVVCCSSSTPRRYCST